MAYQAESRRAEHCCCNIAFKRHRKHREVSLVPERTIDRRAANLEGLRDGRGTHSLRDWLLGGGAAFLGARRKLSGLPLLATILAAIIAADLTTRLLPQHFSGPLTWLDYVLLPSGLVAALFLLTAKRAAWFTATKLIAATAAGLICTAAEAGIQDAPLISLRVLIQTIDPDVRACPTERLGQGGRLVFGDIRRDGHGRYWYEPAGGKTPDCKGL